jgi:hypothetical protein
MEASGAGANCDGVGVSAEFAYRLFKRHRLFAHAQRGRVEHAEHRLAFCFRYIWR